MPVKRVQVEGYGPGRRLQPRGFLGSTYDALTAAENQSVVRSIAIFGAAIGFLSSPWAEFLLPPV